MKTKFTIILALIANTLSAQMLTRGTENLDTLCQTKFTAVYQYSINTSDAEGNSVTDSIRLALQVGDGVWKTWTYERYLFERQKDEEIGEDRYWFMHNEALMHIATTLVGYPEGKTVTQEPVPPLYYEVREDTKAPTWNMVEETDSISGYLCKKAHGEFRGKIWNVFYAEDIPTVAGPWKLHGLPGLITYAIDDEGIHTFKLIGLYQETVPITYSAGYLHSEFIIQERRISTTVVPYEKVTREQMQKHKKDTFGNRQYLTTPMFYMTGPKTIFHTYGPKSGEYQFVSGLYIPDKAHKYQPLELE